MRSYRIKTNLYFLILFFIANILFGQNTFLKTYGMPGDRFDRGYDVLEADDGGYVAVGETGYYHISGHPSEYFGNIFLIKTDIYGDTLWTKTYGNNEHDRAFSLDKTDDGGYIIAGYESRSGLWIIKTDELGDSIWTKRFELGLGQGKSICKTSDGGYVVTGANWRDSNGNYDAYLLKIDSLGNKQWLRNYKKGKENEGLFLQQTNDNGFIISAMTNYKSWHDIWLLKTDYMGDIVWSKIISTNKYATIGYSVCQTTDSGYFIAGTNSEMGWEGIESNIYLLKTDSVGDTIWTKTIRKSPSDIAYSGCQTADGGYIAVGETITNDRFDSNIYIVKLDYEGNILWTSEIGNKYNNNFRGRSIAETRDSGFIITGLKIERMFDYTDLCLLKVDSKGILTSLKNEYNTTLPQDFLLFQNYPNPFNPTTTIKYSIPSSKTPLLGGAGGRLVTLKVYDILGRKVATLVNKEQSTGNYEVTFNAKNLPSGVYYYQLNADNYTETKKMILIR